MKASATRGLVLAVSLSFASPLCATDYRWDLGVSGTWGTPYFWDPGTGFPNGPGDRATISTFAQPGNQSYDVILDGNYSVGQFTHNSFDASFQASGKNFTVHGDSFYGGGSMIFSGSTYTTNGIFTHANGPFDLISSSISGTGSFNKQGGTLNMRDSAINVPANQDDGNILMLGFITFGGPFDNNAGTLDLFGQTDVPAQTALNLGANDLSNAGTIKMRTGTPGTYIPNIAINGSGTLTNTGTILIEAGVGGTRKLNLAVDNQGTLSSGTSLTITETGAAQGNSGSLVVTSGDLVVSGAHTFTNAHLVQATTGNISITGNSAAGSQFSNSAPSAQVIAGGNLTIGGFRTIDNLGAFSAGGNAIVNGTGGSPTIFDHSGSVVLGAGGSFTMTTSYPTSQLIIQPGSTFNPGAALDLTGVTLVLNQSLNLGTADFNLNGGSISGTGTLTRANGSSSALTFTTLGAPLDTAGLTTFTSTNTVTGHLTNRSAGRIDLNHGTTLNLDLNDLTNEGILELLAGSGATRVRHVNATTSTASLVNAPAASVIVQGTGLRQFEIPVDNQGHFALTAAASWNKSGATQLNSGTISTSASFGIQGARSCTNSGAITSTGGTLTLDGNSDPAAAFLNTGTIQSLNGIVLSDFETMTNDNLIDLDGGALTVTIGESSNPQAFVNNGQIDLAPGTSASFTYVGSGGTITLADGSSLGGGGAISINNLGLIVAGSWSPGTSPVTLTSVPVSGTGALTIDGGNTLSASFSTLGIPINIDGGATFSGTNTLNEAFTNEASATVTLNTGANLTLNNEDFTNHGQVDLGGGGTLITISSSSQMLVNSPTGAIDIAAGGTERRLYVDLDNQGTLTTGSTLRLGRTNGSSSNSGTITASGTLQLNNVQQFTNSGDITSTGGFLNLDGNSNPAATFLNTGTITGQNGISLTDFETMTNDNLIDLDVGTLAVSIGESDNPQAFVNNSTIDLAPGTTANFNPIGGGGSVTLASGSTLDGGGAINIGSLALSLGGAWSPNTSSLALTSTKLSGGGSLSIINGGTLTSTGVIYGVPTTLRGNAAFSGTNTLNTPFVNQDDGTLTLATGSTLNVNNVDFTNHGLFELSAGGTLSTVTSTTQTFVNSPSGTINMPAGSSERRFTLDLDNQGQITADSVLRFSRTNSTVDNSGTITTSRAVSTSGTESFSNSGVITATGGSWTIDGNGTSIASFQNTGTITADSGLSIADFETANNDNLIDFDGGVLAITLGESGNPQSFLNNGQIDLAPGTTANLSAIGSGGTFTMATGSSLDGGGAINVGGLNLSLAEAYSPNTSSLALTGTTLLGAGSLDIIGGSSLSSSGATYGVPVANTGDTDFSYTNTINNGFTNGPGGSFTVANTSTLNINNDDFTNQGFFEMTGGSTISTVTSASQGFVNSPTGTISLPAGSAERRLDLNLDNQGQITADSKFRVNRNGGTLTNSGTITANSQLSTSGLASFSNTGEITAGGLFNSTANESFTNAGTIGSTGGLLSFDGTSSAAAAFLNTGTITGQNGITIADFETATNGNLIDLDAGALTVTLGESGNPQAFLNNSRIDLAPGTTASFNAIGSGGTVTLADGSTLEGGGAISVGSLGLSLAGAYSPNTSDLSLTSTTVSGAGSLTINSGSALASAGATYSVPTTIDGNANFSGTNTLNTTFDNESAGIFTLATGSTLTINSSDFTNRGLFAMAGGSTLSTVTSTSQTLVNTPTGTIDLAAGTSERRLSLSLDNQGQLTTASVLRLNRANSAVSNSGSIATTKALSTSNIESFDNAGTLSTTGGSLTIDGNGSGTSAFSNSGTVTADGGFTIADFETMTNDSLINLDGGTLTVWLGESGNDQSFTNNGQIDLAPGTTATFNPIGSGSTLTLASGSTLDGGGAINIGALTLSLGGAYSPNSSPLALTSTTVSGTGPLTIISGGSLASTGVTYNTPVSIHGSAAFSGNHTINAAFTNDTDGHFTLATTSSVTLNNSDFTNHGLFELTGGSTISTLTSTTQSFVNSPTGAVHLPAGSAERRFTLALDNQGAITADSTLRLYRANVAYTNSGSITNSARLYSTSIESFTNSGTVTSTGGEINFDGNDSGTSAFENTGTITSSNELIINDFENTNNSGLMELASGDATINMGAFNNAQQFTNTGEVRIAAGSTFTLATFHTATSTNAAGSRLTGSGTFDHGTVSFTNHGVVAPGLSAGVLTVSPDLTNNATAEFEIEVLSDAGPGVGHDQIHVTGDLVLDGILKPRLVGGYVPLPSDTFLIVRADGELTGDFAGIDQPESFGTWSVTVDEADGEVTISFTQTGPLAFADFQDLYFTPQQIAHGDADANNDFDGDGLSNYLEWVFGSNPLLAGGGAGTFAIDAVDGPTIDLTYPESTLLPSTLQVGIDTSPTLAPGWDSVPTTDFTRHSVVPIPGHPNVNLVTLRITNPTYSADPQRFFRLSFADAP